MKDQLGLYAPPMVAGMALYENGGSTGQYGVEVLFNGVAIHSPPMALSFVTNALLGQDKCKWLIDWLWLIDNWSYTLPQSSFRKNAAPKIENLKCQEG